MFLVNLDYLSAFLDIILVLESAVTVEITLCFGRYAHSRPALECVHIEGLAREMSLRTGM